MDIKLGTDHDIEISKADFVLLSGKEAIAQHLRIKFGFFLGEWFLDTRVGIDYFGQVFVKNVDPFAVDAIFKQVILGTPGVLSISNYTSDFEPSRREFSVDFDAVVTGDEILNFSERFIL